MHRSVWLLLALAITAVVLWLLSVNHDSAGRSFARPGAPLADPAGSGPAQATGDATVTPLGTSHEPDVAATGPSISRNAILSESKLPARTVTGSVRVRDGEGGFLNGLSGIMKMRVETRGSRWRARSRLQRVEVKRGSFDAHFPEGSTIGGDTALLDGRAVRFDVVGHAVLEQEIIELTGRFEDGRLRVVDSVTGDDLDHVTLVEAAPSGAGLGHGCFLLPPAGVGLETLREDATSPLRIEAHEVPHHSGRPGCFVRARGYGWHCFEWQSPPKVEQVIELQPEATLTITVVNLPRQQTATLRLRPIPDSQAESMNGWWRLWEQPLDPSAPTVILDALEPRPLEVSVEIGRAGHERRLVLAEAEIELKPGRKTNLLLTCIAPPEAPPPVPLAGTLRVPIAWEIASNSIPDPKRVAIRFEMRDRPADLDGTTRAILQEDLIPTGTPGLFRWDAGEVLPGSFVAIIRCDEEWTDSWSTEFIVGPTGNRHLALELPPPAALIIRLEEAPGLAPMFVEWRAGSGQPEPLAFGMRLGPGPHELRLPIGPVLVTAGWLGDQDTFRAAARRLQLRPGRNEVTLEVNRRVGLRLVFAEDAASLPGRAVESRESGFSRDDWRRMFAGDLPSNLRIEPQDGGGELLGWSGRSDITFFMSAPGRYRVSLDGLTGYQPVAPRVIDLEDGAVAELRIELERD